MAIDTLDRPAVAATTRDSLGWRRLFAVVVPSTNTSVQPEYDAMRPHGVTNHIARITIPDTRVTDDDSFMVMLNNIRRATLEAVAQAMSMAPDDLIMGMSAETFWDGAEGAERMHRALRERTGRAVVMGSQAVHEALKAYGGIRRIAVITPYMPVGDAQVRRFFEDCGYDVVAVEGLKCASPRLIAHVSEADLKRAVERVNGPDVDAIVQCGTNLAFARVAAIAEFWLEKPVIAINTATYWWALRSNGIPDRMRGFGRLLAEF
ncbi:MAG: arylmalonate decarboxylase [Sphingomonadaceae bacterium]|uniref:maleate cis-trans isomerase family protein n=1 Tax=Thermaurantiacus sp. TaxID=2820283 RepID=UPI00298EE1AE|nr:arylmalonate decarboxylase [Thermaurantiacus sp.]MCS6987584.1 arylmalonate decarboxylase [Sphingomonadaceae bacterium]MDW8415185.1 arylmalonate decarboxylase [Thermaurantiacus sp.]